MGKPKSNSKPCHVGFYANEARAFTSWTDCSAFACGKVDHITHNFKTKTIAEAHACAAWISSIGATKTLTNTQCKSLRQQWLEQPKAQAHLTFSLPLTRSRSRREHDDPSETNDIQHSKPFPVDDVTDRSLSPPPTRRHSRTQPPTPTGGTLARTHSTLTPEPLHRNPNAKQETHEKREKRNSSQLTNEKRTSSQAKPNNPALPRSPGTPPPPHKTP
jgi:hypothetical protein